MLRTSAFALVLAAACGKVLPPAVDAHTGIDGALNADAMEDVDAPAAADAKAPDGHPADAMPGTKTFTANSMWACASGADCEDVYDFDASASGTVTVTVSAVTGNSVPRLELFKGSTTTGTNLFDNAATPVCGTMDASLTGGPTTVVATHYRLAVGRDWGNSAGSGGNYALTITSSVDMNNLGQTADDAASNLPHCP
jgi:hypothetical protein